MDVPCVIETPRANGLNFAFATTHFVIYSYRTYLLFHESFKYTHNAPVGGVLLGRHPPSGPPSSLMRQSNVIVELWIQICVLSVIL